MSDVFDMIQRNNVKRILNDHIGSANTISQKEWYDLVFLTLETLKKPLLQSFGKYASNSLVIYDNVSATSVFTQDGIHIVSSFEFASLIQKYIAKYVQYIGERVEKSARDGTTTSMLLFIMILETIYKDFDNMFFSEDKVSFKNINIMIHEYSKTIEKVLKDILEHIEKIKISIDEASKYHSISKEKIIYDISYVTSKGNKDLSETMVEMFKDIPADIYDYFVYYRSEIETENPFEIYIQKCDYEFKTLLRSGRAYFDKEMNTLFKGNVDLIILPETIFDSDREKISNIESIIDSSKRDLVIVWNSINDQLVNVWEKKYKDKRIVMLQYVNYVQNLKDSGIELNGLLKGSFKTTKDYFIEDVDVTISMNNIEINGFLEFKDKINKFYYNKDHEFYKFLKNIQLYIQKLKNSHTKSDVEFELKEITKIYRKLIAPKYPVLRIGGRTLDHLAMIDVTEDTVGALTVAFNNGIVIDGLKSLLQFIKHKFESDRTNRACEIIFNKIKYLYSLSLYNVPKECRKNNRGVIQNYMILKETFERLLEILPKLIITTSVIVPGGVSLNKDNK